jgi:hypothetical protein
LKPTPVALASAAANSENAAKSKSLPRGLPSDGGLSVLASGLGPQSLVSPEEENRRKKEQQDAEEKGERRFIP